MPATARPSRRRCTTLVELPPYSPDLNPVERIWLYLRERDLSHRLLADYDAVVDACCRAWNALTAEPGRIKPSAPTPPSQRSEHKRGGIKQLRPEPLAGLREHAVNPVAPRGR